MNEQMPHDDKLRDLYRGLPADEPPAHLDEAILAAARSQDGRKGGRRRGAVVRRLRWALPLAAAAGLVLTVQRLVPERAGNLPEVSAPAAILEEAAPTASSDERARQDLDLAFVDGVGLRDEDEKVARERRRPVAEALPAPVAKRKGEAREGKEVPIAPADSADAAAPPAAAQRRLSSMKSLGYMQGDEAAAAAITAKRQEAEQEARKAAETNVASAAVERESDDASPRENQAELMAEAGEVRSGGPEAAGLEAEPAPSATKPADPWPFLLEPGLAREETCRRLTKATGADCEFFAGFLEVRLSPPVAIDRGKDVGSLASSLTLELRDDRLWSLGVTIREADGSTSHRAFVTQQVRAPAVVDPQQE